MDNVAVDNDFDKMQGEDHHCIIESYSSSETRLFQSVVLQDLLNKEETPAEFITWLHTAHGKKICSLADLNPSFLEMAANKLDKIWGKISKERLLQAMSAIN